MCSYYMFFFIRLRYIAVTETYYWAPRRYTFNACRYIFLELCYVISVESFVIIPSSE